MMRIAVAGGGGLGYLIASELASAANTYNVVVLSRSNRQEYADLDVQVLPVDYNEWESLSFALQGVNLIISTFAGNGQINLINAAARAGVRYFIPSEFEGTLGKRPSRNDPLDQGSSQAIALLRQWAQASRMRYTVFSCGIFMERFHPYGLGAFNIGNGTGSSAPGEYLLDNNQFTAEYVVDSRRNSGRICMTSVYDVARFIVAAVDLGPSLWPEEFTMRGDRMHVHDIVGMCSRVRNAAFIHNARQIHDVESWISYFTQQGEYGRVAYYQRLLATVNGRYDFSQATLTDAIDRNNDGSGAFRPVTFRVWLTSIWQPV